MYSSKWMRLLFATTLAAGVPSLQAQDLDGIPIVSPNPGDRGAFGISVSGVPDSDGDGGGDLLIGAYTEDGGANEAGRVYLLRGTGASLLRTLVSPNPGERGLFGASVSGVPDADGDGRGDLLVGAPGENAGASGSGRAYLFSGATGALLQSLVSATPFPFGQFGNSVSGVADADGDGRGDLLIGAVTAGADFAGRVHLFSGATGTLLFTLAASGSSNFGASVSGVPDVDGDSRGDLLVGAAQSDRAYLYNGATGARMATVASLTSGQFSQFGHAVAGVPDVDGDGGGDLLIGAFAEEVGGTTTDGRAYLFYTAVLVDTEDAPEATGVALRAAPNPASGGATVTVSLLMPAAVTVSVYDVLGRQIARLHTGPLAQGTHPLPLDTSRLPTGVYVVRASTPEAVLAQRITVVR